MESGQANHDELLSEFMSITDVSSEAIAETYLEACSNNLEAAVGLFFGGQDPPPPPAPQPPAAAAAAPAAPPPDDYVEIMDDDDDDDEAGGAALAELGRQRARALAARQQAAASEERRGLLGQDSDDAMDLSGGGAGAAAPLAAGAAVGAGAAGEDDDDADLRAVAAAMGEGDLDSYHRQQQQQLLAHYQAQAAGQPFDGGGLQQQQPAGEGGEGPEGAAAAAAGLRDALPLDLPDGIDVEEARMLEAAMLGVPYAGRIPDFSAAAAAPLSPGTMEQRSLRQEQDAAYEESLALDRAKQQSVAAAAAEVEAAKRAEQEAQTAEEARAAAAAAALQALLATKAQRLPREAPDGEAGSLAIVVRLPSGQRKGRRFRPSDPLQAVFDFVDVECSSGGTAGAADAAGGSASGGCEQPSGITPGSYRLVSQFPRKVFVEDGSSSLQDAGITSDCALFIEPL